MTSVQLIIIIITNLGSVTISILVTYLISYSKKQAEYEALQKNLEGVIRAQEEMKNNLEIDKDAKKHLREESRRTIFSLNAAVDKSYETVHGIGYNLDDYEREKERFWTVYITEYISAKSSFFLMNDVSLEVALLLNEIELECNEFMLAVTSANITAKNLIAAKTFNQVEHNQQVMKLSREFWRRFKDKKDGLQNALKQMLRLR